MLKAADVWLMVDPSVGPPLSEVVGGVVSTVQDREAGVVSTFPDGSTARTVRVQVPFWVRLLNVAPFFGHEANEPTLPGGSSLHWKVASGSEVALKLVKLAL